MAYRLALISVSLDTRLYCQTTDRGLAQHSVSVYTPAFADTHRAYPRRDGQAEFTPQLLLILIVPIHGGMARLS